MLLGPGLGSAVPLEQGTSASHSHSQSSNREKGRVPRAALKLRHQGMFTVNLTVALEEEVGGGTGRNAGAPRLIPTPLLPGGGEATAWDSPLGQTLLLWGPSS